MHEVTNTKTVRALLQRVAEAASEDTPSFLSAAGAALSYLALLCDDVDFLQALVADLKVDSAAYQRGHKDGLQMGRGECLEMVERAVEEAQRTEYGVARYPSLTITDRTENLP